MAARRGTRKSPAATSGDARSLTSNRCSSNSNVRLSQPLSQPHPPYPNVQISQPPLVPPTLAPTISPLTPPAVAATALPDD
jgi:hypothetical protein